MNDGATMELATLGPLMALLAVLLGVVAIGWDPALRSMTGPDPGIGSFVFSPRFMPAWVLLMIMIAMAGALIVIGARSEAHWMIVATPLALAATYRATIALAQWNYRRRLRQQVFIAVTQLAAMVSGSASVFSAFRAVGRSSPWPLRDEWTWVEAHLNVPYAIREHGALVMRHADHAVALRALAEQTPLALHARVLEHLATIYEQGAESNAPERLRQLAEIIEQQASLRRAIHGILLRIRGEAYVIVGAMALLAFWLGISQPERMAEAFVGNGLAPAAMLWFGLWMAAPLITTILISRTPELPL